MLINKNGLTSWLQPRIIFQTKRIISAATSLKLRTAKEKENKSRFIHSPTAMFCFTVSCLHVKFSIWNNKMTELTLCYGSIKKILVEK